MTDKEKIRVEIVKRMKGECLIICSYIIYKDILNFIDSMQEEPVSEDLEEAADCYKDMITPEEVDDPEHAYSYEAYTEYQIVDAFISGAKWQKEKDGSITEDLEKASKEWLSTQLDKSYANYGEAKMMELTHFDGYAMLDAIEFGAIYQKQQMMAKAIDGKVIANGMGNPILHLWDKGRHLIGKKVKVIVIKED